MTCAEPTQREAQLPMAFGVDCHVRPALREINFGQWEGLTWEEIEGRDEAYARRWIAEYPRLPAPDGEDFRDFERRVLDEVRFLSIEAETQRPHASRSSLMQECFARCCARCMDAPKKTHGSRRDRTARIVRHTYRRFLFFADS